MSLDASVRMVLAKKKITQDELAEIVGRRRETVSSWCNGHSEPDFTTQKKMADMVDIAVSEFIKWGEL